jgi:hypothetical protein
LKLTIRWIPGHKDVLGNERADQEAKKAAAGNVTNKNQLPTFPRQRVPWNQLSVIKSGWERINEKQIAARWNSQRYRKLKRIDAVTKPAGYLKLTMLLLKVHASILFQLRTEHIGLNGHLFHINRSDSP